MERSRDICLGSRETVCFWATEFPLLVYLLLWLMGSTGDVWGESFLSGNASLDHRDVCC